MIGKLTFSFVSGALLALAATGLVFKTEPAIAQQAAAETVEEVVIKAPPAVHRTVRIKGMQYELTEIKRSVSYADLDLTLHADVIELQGRIEAAAREVCEELADKHPMISRPEPSCIKDAIDSATEEVHQAIAAAIS